MTVLICGNTNTAVMGILSRFVIEPSCIFHMPAKIVRPISTGTLPFAAKLFNWSMLHDGWSSFTGAQCWAVGVCSASSHHAVLLLCCFTHAWQHWDCLVTEAVNQPHGHFSQCMLIQGCMVNDLSACTMLTSLWQICSGASLCTAQRL